MGTCRAGLRGRGLDCSGGPAWQESRWGLGRRPGWGGGALAEGRPRAAVAPSALRALFLRTATGESLCGAAAHPRARFRTGLAWVPHKLRAGCLGGGILNVTYCRLFMRIGSHFNVLNMHLLPAVEAAFQKPLEMTSHFYQLMFLE